MTHLCLLSPRSIVALCLSLGFVVSGCGSSNPKVVRVASTMQTDLSGQWNDTDAQLTSQSLISECFNSLWLQNFARDSHRVPAIRVASIVNRTDEHIDAQIFIKSVESAMLKSGRVRVLAQAGAETDAIDVEQLRTRSGREKSPNIVVPHQETGADFVVAARVASILDQVQGHFTKFYKITFELISPSTGEKVWIGEHEIKKLVSQDHYRW